VPPVVPPIGIEAAIGVVIARIIVTAKDEAGTIADMDVPAMSAPAIAEEGVIAHPVHNAAGETAATREAPGCSGSAEAGGGDALPLCRGHCGEGGRGRQSKQRTMHVAAPFKPIANEGYTLVDGGCCSGKFTHWRGSFIAGKARRQEKR
jgi:hypothetical protein